MKWSTLSFSAATLLTSCVVWCGLGAWFRAVGPSWRLVCLGASVCVGVVYRVCGFFVMCVWFRDPPSLGIRLF